jgi:hypothetical protein
MRFEVCPVWHRGLSVGGAAGAKRLQMRIPGLEILRNRFGPQGQGAGDLWRPARLPNSGGAGYRRAHPMARQLGESDIALRQVSRVNPFTACIQCSGRSRQIFIRYRRGYGREIVQSG